MNLVTEHRTACRRPGRRPSHAGSQFTAVRRQRLGPV